MNTPVYPSGLRELPFVQAYYRTTLRKPQVVSDTVLRSLMTSGQDDRLILVAALATELTEACRRVTAIEAALRDRRYPVAQMLHRELPGAAAWQAFLDRATALPPEAMLRDLGLGDDALPAAEVLRGQPDLSWVTGLIAAAETGNVLALIQRAEGPGARPPVDVWIGGYLPESTPEASTLTASVDDAATMADTTADMVSVGQGFLGAYLAARLGAGQVEE